MDEQKAEQEKGYSPEDQMHARRVMMADGRRYMIFYTFGKPDTDALPPEENPKALSTTGEGGHV